MSQKYITLANSLSKVHRKGTHVDLLKCDVSSHVNDLPVSDDIWEKIKAETADDQVLLSVIRSLRSGQKLPSNFIHRGTYMFWMECFSVENRLLSHMHYVQTC